MAGSLALINKSAGNNVSYAWDLDGNMLNGYESAEKDPVYGWHDTGDVTISLVTYNCNSTDTFRKTIHVFAPAKPKVSFTADNTDPALGDIVYLRSTTLPDCIERYKWSFKKTYASATDTGSALFANNTGPESANPSVIFTDTGYYTASLYAEDFFGRQKDSVSVPLFIKVRPAYCVPNIVSVLKSFGFSEVKFAGIDHKTMQGSTTYTSHVNEPALAMYAEVGLNYTLTVKRDSPFTAAETRAVYIDWNHDGSFQRVALDSDDAVNATWTSVISIPKNAKLGPTVMRIASGYGQFPMDECGLNTYGQYEDYRLYITADTGKPVIILSGKDTMDVEEGLAYHEPGYKAISAYYADISSKVKVTVDQPALFSLNGGRLLHPGTYTISYTVSDTFGEQATAYRYVNVLKDTMRPQLVVAGPDTTILEADTTGYANLPKILLSEDNMDGTTSDSIVPAKVSMHHLGFVKVGYYTHDKSGNYASTFRWLKFYDSIPPVMRLIGKDTVYSEIKKNYKDPGVSIRDNYYSDTLLKTMVRANASININTPGIYYENYTLTDPSGNVAKPLMRTVIIAVMDTIAPVVHLKKDTVTISVYSTWRDTSVTVTDVDDAGRLQPVVKLRQGGTFFNAFASGYATRLGLFTVTYTATDSSGNSSTTTQYVRVADMKPPVIRLIGSMNVSVCFMTDYQDSGYVATDDYSKTITIDTVLSYIPNPDTTQPPVLYRLRYKGIDSSGNIGFSNYRYIYVRTADDELCKNGLAAGLSLDKYISVFPNPTTGLLNIRSVLPASEKLTVSITDVLGKPIAGSSFDGFRGNFSIDLSGHAAGIYFLNICTAHDKLSRQIILSR